MALLEAVEGAAFQPEELAKYGEPEKLGALGVQWDLPSELLSAEATRTSFGLLAMREDRVLAAVDLNLAVRLRVDEAVHLWSDESRALKAAVIVNFESRSMHMTLTFSPVSQSARQVYSDALFLHALSDATHMRLRLPDGQTAPDKLPVPDGIEVDGRSLRLFQLLADISELSGLAVPIPENIDEELVRDLLTARQLLRGQVVTGRWTDGQLTFDAAAFETLGGTFDTGERHQLLSVAPMSLDIRGAVIPLGEIQQVMSDAEVAKIQRDGETVVVHLRAHGGSAPSSMTPASSRSEDISPRVILKDEAFDRLVADLDAPPRYSKLQELL